MTLDFLDFFQGRRALPTGKLLPEREIAARIPRSQVCSEMLRLMVRERNVAIQWAKDGHWVANAWSKNCKI